ncbi:MAG: hypothetical protein HY815_08940 [Candidatus Riflebacteria bacterium]|nr:hypothetical protein [Candidatus Riflebacteria bacterium]
MDAEERDWAVPIGRLFGIPVRAHWSLVLVAGAVIATGLLRTFDVHTVRWLAGAGALFICSLAFHELVHALVARRLGYRTISVELHVFGGIPRLSGWPAAGHETLISLAAPLASLAVFGVLEALSGYIPPGAGAAAGVAARCNLLLGLVNLVPAPPLDAGRALLGALQLELGAGRGGLTAHRLGMWVAALAMVCGLALGATLALVAFAEAYLLCRGRGDVALTAIVRDRRGSRRRRFDDEPAGRLDDGDGDAAPGRARSAQSRGRSRRVDQPLLRVIKGGRA